MNKVKNIVCNYIFEHKKLTVFTCVMFLAAVIISLVPAKITQLIIDEGFMSKDYEKYYIIH